MISFHRPWRRARGRWLYARRSTGFYLGYLVPQGRPAGSVGIAGCTVYIWDCNRRRHCRWRDWRVTGRYDVAPTRVTTLTSHFSCEEASAHCPKSQTTARLLLHRIQIDRVSAAREREDLPRWHDGNRIFSGRAVPFLPLSCALAAWRYLGYGTARRSVSYFWSDGYADSAATEMQRRLAIRR